MGVEPTPPGAALALKECSSHEVQMTITQSMHCHDRTMKTFHQVHTCTYLVYFTYNQTKLKSIQIASKEASNGQINIHPIVRLTASPSAHLLPQVQWYNQISVAKYVLSTGVS